METLGKSFTLTDDETSRVCSFRMPNARAGLEIASLGLNPKDPEILQKLADIAACHLILEADSGRNLPRQEVKSIDELGYIFKDPFIGIELVKAFEEAVSPLLKRLKI